MRRKARKDNNHNEIMEAFLKHSASAHDTSRLGDDFPDLVIGMYGLTVLVEVKDGSKPPSARKLTDGQFAFFRDFRGWTAVIKSVDEVPTLLQIMKQEAEYRLAGFEGMTGGEPKEEWQMVDINKLRLWAESMRSLSSPDFSPNAHLLFDAIDEIERFRDGITEQEVKRSCANPLSSLEK